MSKAIEEFNKIFEDMSAEIEKAQTDEEVEAIQKRYESIVDDAEKSFESALEKEFEEEAKAFEEDAKKLESDTGDKTEDETLITKLSGLSEKQLQHRFKKTENLEFAKILGLEVSEKMTEKEIVKIIFNFLRTIEEK